MIDQIEEETLDAIGGCSAANATTFQVHRDYIDNFSMLNVNMHSMPGNYRSLLAFLSTLKFRISLIIVTESWFKNVNDIPLFNIQGYKSEFVNRACALGGGIIVYYLEHIKVSKIIEFTNIFPTHEGLALNVSLPH